MKISDTNMFGLKLFTQPIEPNTILTFVKQYQDLLNLKGGFSESDNAKVGFDLFALLTYPKITSDFLNESYGKELLLSQDIKFSIDLMKQNTNYLFRPEIFALAEKISLKNFSISYLKKLRTQKSTYLLDQHRFFRFFKTDTEIVGGLFSKDLEIQESAFLNLMPPEIAKLQKEFGFDYNLFRIDLITNEVEIDDIKFSDVNFNDDFRLTNQYETYKQFIQLLLFVCLSEPEIEILPPNSKIGATRANKVVNQTNSEIVVVSSKWNKISIRAEGFKVNGHFRLQPCGKDRQDVKLIFVDTFQKHGYIRRPNKEFNQKIIIN